MGKFKDENGKTRIGTFLKSLGSVGDDILNIAGDLTGIEALNTIGDAIGKSDAIDKEMKNAAFNLIMQDLEDIKNARETSVRIQESQNSSWMAKNMPFIYDSFILGIWGFMTIYILLRWMGIITDNTNIDMTGLLGIYSGVTSLATLIITFHRGSSSGSKEKSGMLFGKR